MDDGWWSLICGECGVEGPRRTGPRPQLARDRSGEVRFVPEERCANCGKPHTADLPVGVDVATPLA